MSKKFNEFTDSYVRLDSHFEPKARSKNGRTLQDLPLNCFLLLTLIKLTKEIKAT